MGLDGKCTTPSTALHPQNLSFIMAAKEQELTGLKSAIAIIRQNTQMTIMESTKMTIKEITMVSTVTKALIIRFASKVQR